MTAPFVTRAKHAARARLGPVARRFGVTPDLLNRGPSRSAALDAQLEQVVRVQERLEAYIDRTKEELGAAAGQRDATIATAEALLAELRPEDGPAGAGESLAARLDHAMLHADARAAESVVRFDREVADLRSTIRLTQALVERALGTQAPVAGDTSSTAGSEADPPVARFDHAVPSFDVLYRSFEDRHRGAPEEIVERQREDYLDLLVALPNPELPIVDVGCGRGELVGLLESSGHPAVGVDSNLGQVSDARQGTFHEADLFTWLDRQDDGSCRAVVSMHVIEHLPSSLQIRLVFEARRVLAEGGVLILETPNTLSLNIGASNFWVDPTHHRPVHPLFIEFLASQAGFAATETRFLHPIPVEFPANESTAELVRDLNSLILGPGDLALIATR